MFVQNAFMKKPACRLAVEILVIYLAPVILIEVVWGAVFFLHFRVFMAFFVVWAAVAACYGRMSGLSFSAMGFTRRSLMRSFLLSGIVTLLAIGVILWLAGPRLVTRPHLPRSLWFPLFYVFLSCPAQEFLYRGLAFSLMERGGVKSGVALIIVSALLYASLHIFFTKPLVLPLTFLIGLGWGTMYLWVRNLWGLILSHIVVGMIAIAAGLA